MAILIFEWIMVLYLHYNNPYHFITMSFDSLKIILIGLAFIVMGYYFVNSFYIKKNDALPGDILKITLNEELIGKIILFLSFIVFW